MRSESGIAMSRQYSQNGESCARRRLVVQDQEIAYALVFDDREAVVFLGIARD